MKLPIFADQNIQINRFVSKKLLFTLLLFITMISAYAQNTNYTNRMQHIFGNIDRTKVTTGFLKEFGIRFNEVEAYDGIIDTDNLVDQTQWQWYIIPVKTGISNKTLNTKIKQIL